MSDVLASFQTALVVAAHADDETLGCGGTLRRIADAGGKTVVLILGDGERSRADEGDLAERIEARRAKARKACARLGVDEVVFADFPDNRFDAVDRLDLVRAVESVVARLQPTAVLTHSAADLNIDHRRAHEATLVAARMLPESPVQTLWAFEVLSATDAAESALLGAFRPQIFVDIRATLPAKLEAAAAYGTEIPKAPHPRSIEAVAALATRRGHMVGLESAEAFELLRHRVVA